MEWYRKVLKSGLVLAIVFAVGVSVWVLLSSKTALVGDTHYIHRTDTGYAPAEITIMVGDTIVWMNDSDVHHWPASDIHPTHSIYPEFDPLEPIGPGESWAFTFKKVGEWRFHDHIRANLKGTVTVVE